MELEDICKLCRLCGTLADKLIDVLNVVDDSSSTLRPNLLEIIHNCLPVQINNYDALPKKVCEKCCDKSVAVYEFVNLILSTQKMFLRNLDNVELIKSNTSKVIERFAFDGHQKDKPPDSSISKPVTSECSKATNDPVQQVFENLRKNRINVTISKVKCSKSPSSFPPERLTESETETNSKEEHLSENATSTNDETNQIIEYYEEYLNDFDQSNEELETIEKECENTSVEPTSIKTASLIVQPVNNVTKSTKPTVIKMLCEASFVCMTCKVNVQTFEELRMHMKTNIACKRINLTCDVCGKICDSKKSLYQHTLTHKEKTAFICEECGKAYTNRFNLENHKSSFHGEQVEEYGSIYKCKICDDQFTNRRDLYDHLSNHRKMPSVNLCDTCGKCFNSPEQLRSHVRVHSDHRPFPCSYCEKKFRSRLQQLQHLHVHNGEKQFICMQCGKAFAKRGSLITHSRLHNGETPFACSQCDEKFSSSGKLKTHSKCHIVVEEEVN